MNWIENFVKKSYAYLQIEKQLKGKKQGHTPNKAYLTEAQRIGPETTTRIQDVRSMCQASGFKLDSCLAVTNKVSYEGFWVVFFFLKSRFLCVTASHCPGICSIDQGDFCCLQSAWVISVGHNCQGRCRFCIDVILQHFFT